MYKEGLLVVLSGPSGTGKGAVCSALLKARKDIALSVSCTTRKPRKGEKDGINYFFRTEEEFTAMIGGGKLLEYAKVFDHYYGTPLEYVMQKLSQGCDVLLEIDVQGAMKVREKFPEGVFIFIAPPSMEELSARIRMRGTEDEAEINKRLNQSAAELSQMGHYDYIVVNDVIPTVVDKIGCILCAEKLKAARNASLAQVLARGEIVG